MILFLLFGRTSGRGEGGGVGFYAYEILRTMGVRVSSFLHGLGKFSCRVFKSIPFKRESGIIHWMWSKRGQDFEIVSALYLGERRAVNVRHK